MSTTVVLPRKKEGRSHDMANRVSKRSLVAVIIMVIASGCTGSTASPPATSGSATGGTATVEQATAKPVTDVLKGGRYLFGPFGDTQSTIVATGPDRWVGYPSWAMDGPEPVRADARLERLIMT